MFTTIQGDNLIINTKAYDAIDFREMEYSLDKIIGTRRVISQECDNTGGGCMIDVIIFANGKVITANEECMQIYPTLDLYWLD